MSHLCLPVIKLMIRGWSPLGCSFNPRPDPWWQRQHRHMCAHRYQTQCERCCNPRLPSIARKGWH